MQDRLADLVGYTAPDDDITLEIQDSETFARPKCLEGFFRQVEASQDDLMHIQLGTKRINELNSKAVVAVLPKDEQEISNELQQVIDETNKYAAHVKGTIETLKKQNQEAKQQQTTEGSTITPAELRLKDTMYNALTKKFMDTMKEYNKAQQKYKNDIKTKVKRQVQIVKPNATEEEIDMVLRSTDPSQIYRNAILQGNTTDPIRDAYINCQEKYQDVLKLEQSVSELHQMFLDLALLVDQQSEVLDQIEFQVKSASEYIEKGNDEVVKAIRHQACARKKKCIIAVVGLIILIIMLTMAGVKLIPH